MAGVRDYKIKNSGGPDISSCPNFRDYTRIRKKTLTNNRSETPPVEKSSSRGPYRDFSVGGL